MPPRAGDKRAPYHEGLDERLLPTYASDLYLVGLIDGLLAAFACLGTYVNHEPRYGFIEIAAHAEGPEAGLREHYAHLGGTLSLHAASDWVAAVRAALTRVAIDESQLAQPVRGALEHALDHLIGLLAQLFGARSVRALYLRRDHSQSAIGVYGYISDESLAFAVGDDRLYVLGLGWTD